MEIGIGTWAWGDDYWGSQRHSDSLKTIHAAIRNGFNYFDTAPVYGKGRSEQLLGQQLPTNFPAILSSKCFIKPLSAVEKSLNNSLKRLKREHIDHFFIHWPSTKEDYRPMVELLEKFRAEGKIRKIGLSNFNVKQLKKAEEAGTIDIVQNAFNFFWNKESEIFKYCNAKNIETECYSPLAQGLLTGKFNRQNPYKGEDLRSHMSLFNDENIEIVYKYIDELEEIASANNISLHNLILKWTLTMPFIDRVIVGCRKREHIEALTTLENITLNDQTIATITELSDDTSKQIVGGTNIFNHSY